MSDILDVMSNTIDDCTMSNDAINRAYRVRALARRRRRR